MEYDRPAYFWMKIVRLAVAAIFACSATVNANAQVAASSETKDALKHLLQTINTHPFEGLDWHELKLVAVNEQLVTQLKEALNRSKGSAASITEQSLWVDAAGGHPEAVLSLYDNNVIKYPEDKTRLNAACFARAAQGLDLHHVLAVCNAAVAADRKGYTLVFRGMAELQLSLFKEALLDFNEALGDKAFQSHPRLADAAFGRGIARTRLGDPDGMKDIEVAVRANNGVAAEFADIGIIE